MAARHPAAVSLAIASLASFIMGALTVITQWAQVPIHPAVFLVGGAALCAALFETVRLMTRPGRYQVTRTEFQARSRARGWSVDRSADRAARTDQAAFLANPAPPVRRVADYGPAQPASRPHHSHARRDPRREAWERRNRPAPTRERLHDLPDGVDPRRVRRARQR